MAELFKGHIVNDEHYPLPQTESSLGHIAAPAAAPDVDPAEVAAAHSELQQMVRIVGELRPALQEMNEAAHAGARQQGYADGLAQAQRELEQTLMEAMAALTDAQVQKHTFAMQNTAELAELSLKIARKIIGAHLDADPDLVGRIVAHCVAELEPSTALTLRVNETDLPRIVAHTDEINRLVAGVGTVSIVADPTVDRGGCILTSPVGDVDARIETKLHVLEAAFGAQKGAVAASLTNAVASYHTQPEAAHTSDAYAANPEAAAAYSDEMDFGGDALSFGDDPYGGI